MGDRKSTAVLKAVAWWFDRRHESGTVIDDVDLFLKRSDGTTASSSTDALDEKERVFLAGAGGTAYELQLHGDSVTADDEGCGSNSMKVYWALFYEDSDRDDADGPGSEIEVEQ